MIVLGAVWIFLLVYAFARWRPEGPPMPWVIIAMGNILATIVCGVIEAATW